MTDIGLQTTIVTKESACAGKFREDLERVLPMNKDHSGMNKFSSRSDSDYGSLVSKIKELILFAGNRPFVVLLIFPLTML
jgi:hypothetical protein